MELNVGNYRKYTLANRPTLLWDMLEVHCVAEVGLGVSERRSREGNHNEIGFGFGWGFMDKRCLYEKAGIATETGILLVYHSAQNPSPQSGRNST